MPGPIDPIQLAQVLKENEVQKPSFVPNAAPADQFSLILDKAMNALEGVSAMENNSNQLIDKYTLGQASISDVMVATAKTNIAVQLAVTVVTTTVNTFKEITQMQI